MQRLKYLILLILVPLLGFANDSFCYNGFLYEIIDENDSEVALISLTVVDSPIPIYYNVDQPNNSPFTINHISNSTKQKIKNFIPNHVIEKEKTIPSIIIPEFVENNGKEYSVVELRSVYNYEMIVEKRIENNGNSTVWMLDNSITTILLSIPRSVRYINNDFLHKINVNEIILDVDNNYFQIIDDVLYSKDAYTLIKWPNSKKLSEESMFPENLHKIGHGAFFKTEFDSVMDLDNLPSSVDTWDDYCFYKAIIMDGKYNDDFYIPENIKRIGFNSIYFHQQLYGLNLAITGTLHIPAGLEEIGTLDGFTLDGGIIVDEGNPYYFVRDNCLIDRRNEKLCAVYGNSRYSDNVVFTVPDDIKIIGNKAFSNSYVTKLIINDNIETLEPYSLENFRLEEIELPNSITEIPDGLFNKCCNLWKIEIPENVKKIGDFAFFECKKLESISLNSNLESIGDFAFSLCTQLIDINFNSNLKSIGKFAFCGCKYLEKLNWHESLTFIDDCAFYGTRLREIQFPDAEVKLGKDVFAETRYLNTIATGNTMENLSDDWFRLDPPVKGSETSPGNRLVLSVILGENIKTMKLPFYTIMMSTFYCYPNDPPTILSGDFDPGFLVIFTKPDLMGVYSDAWNIEDDGEYIFIRPLNEVGISNTEPDKNQSTGILFNTQGRRVSQDYKGIVIKRCADGSFKKSIR